MVSTLTTRVVVLDQKPSKEYISKEYKIVTQETQSSDNMPGDNDPPTTKTHSRVSVDYPEQTFVKVILHAKNLPKQTGPCDIICMISEEIKRYLALFK